jgi:hypothetical protein
MKKANLILSAVVMTAMMLTCCRGSSTKKPTITNNDSSNKVAHSNESAVLNEITIGKQVWMVENLNVEKFRNGAPIPQANTADEWIKAGNDKQPAWCYYNNDPTNSKKYGKLYNWYAVNDSRGLAPTGWHIPSDSEWAEIEKYLLSNENSQSGLFSILGGFRLGEGKFNRIDEFAGWWSTTEGNANFARGRATYGNGIKLGALNDDMSYGEKRIGLSVRCIRN